MIYNYGLQNKIYFELLKDLPSGAIRTINDHNKMESIARQGDLVFIFNWGDGARKLQKIFSERGVHMFPESKVSLMLADKVNQLRFIDPLTAYPLERVFVENNKLNSFSVPKLKKSEKVVVKIGDEHQGINKFLKTPCEIIRAKENVIFEEYISNARSIRICVIQNNPDGIFIVEQTNSSNADPHTAWIKNIDPEEFVFSYAERRNLGIALIDEIVEDALNISRKLKHAYLGIDYVVRGDKVGLLEVNDMIGLPDDDRVFRSAISFFKTIIEEHKNND